MSMMDQRHTIVAPAKAAAEPVEPQKNAVCAAPAR